MFLSLVAHHTRDKEESIRSFCLSTLQDAGIATIESVLGEEGVFDTLRRIAAAPFNESYHSIVTHFLRYAILKTAQKKDISLTHLGEDALLHLLGEGTSPSLLYLILLVIMQISHGQNWPFWRTFLKAHAASLLITPTAIDSSSSLPCFNKHTGTNTHK